MTATPGASTAELRAAVVLALERAVDGLSDGFAAIMRQQLRETEADATLYGPAVFCLGIGRLITGSEDKALPAATALGLLEEMARVFCDIEASSPARLVASWSMPRTLNAGDGFYAAAQRVLVDDQGLPDVQRLRALAVFSGAARRFSEALQVCAGGREGVERAARSLYAPAAALAAVCCDADEATAKRLNALAEELASQPGATLDGGLQKAAALNLGNA